MKNIQIDENNLKSLINNAAVGLFRASCSGEILFANRKLAMILGYPSVEEMMDDSPKASWFHTWQSHPEILIKLKDMDWLCLESKRENPDGTVIFLKCTLAAEKNGTGSIEFIDGSVEDITEINRSQMINAVMQDLYIRLNSMHDLTGALTYLLDSFCCIEGIDSGGLYFIDQLTGSVDLIHHKGLSEEFIKLVSHYEPDTINAKILKAGFPVFDSYPKAVNNSASPQKLNEGIKTIAILPIKHDGKVIAALNLASHRKNGIPAYLRSALESMTVQFGGTIARLKAESEFRYAVNELCDQEK